MPVVAAAAAVGLVGKKFAVSAVDCYSLVVIGCRIQALRRLVIQHKDSQLHSGTVVAAAAAAGRLVNHNTGHRELEDKRDSREEEEEDRAAIGLVDTAGAAAALAPT